MVLNTLVEKLQRQSKDDFKRTAKIGPLQTRRAIDDSVKRKLAKTAFGKSSPWCPRGRAPGTSLLAAADDRDGGDLDKHARDRESEDNRGIGRANVAKHFS